MLASACPGWVCYAEKRHGNYILPYISTAKSPQQVMGTIVKQHFAKKLGTTPSKIFHVSVMPCYDKKLEASRSDFIDESTGIKDVDCVLTTTEIVDLMEGQGIGDLVDVEPAPDTLSNVDMSCFLPSGEPVSNAGGSGGYADFIFRHAARLLFDQPVDDGEPLQWKAGRNRDMQTLVLLDKETGKKLLKFALVYGFRNIQTLVRQIKSGRCDIDYAEVMACPAGCLNGGGQIRLPNQQGANTAEAEDVDSDSARKELLGRINQLYHSQQNLIPPSEPCGAVKELYQTFCPEQPEPCSPQARQFFHTSFHNIPPMEAKTSIQW